MHAKLLLPALLLIGAAMAAPAAADPFSAKPRHGGGPTAPAPASSRVGGDTMATAVEILSLPYSDSGTTLGAVDDYDEACPFEGSQSPDVVYTYTPTSSGPISIDLCHSDYDTKVFVYDDTGEVVACSDDFYMPGDPACLPFASKIEFLELSGLTTYYIVIDGYDDDAGDYVLDVDAASFYDMDCPPGIRAEGEPPLANGTQDLYNSGCNTSSLLFQELAGGLDGAVHMCVKSGWRIGTDGLDFDTDWLEVTVGPEGSLHCEFDADWTTSVLALMSDDCSDPDILATAHGGRGEPGSFDVAVDPGTVVRLYILPASAMSPTGATPYEYEIDLLVTGLQPTAAANEDRSWGAVKSLYR
ncbi:MAG: hypothetical protein Q7W56_00280 [Candidatus Latescibacteria bacterium]|nr:hypothetical protein [Candidatus Latescibacterota bacterium]